MFIPFYIDINEIDKLQTPNSLKVIDFEKRESSIQELLKSKIDITKGTIDAEEIKNGWLPVKAHYHVFISYSHDDIVKARKLATWLESQGVSCFLDAFFWNNADALLQIIDDAKCKNPNGKTYNYKKRNYSTSLIHAILSMAILEAVDKCDIGFFIKSSHSLTLDFDCIKSHTLSPWIYEELNIMARIDKRVPTWLCNSGIKMFSRGAKMIVESTAPIPTKFEVPLDHLVELEATDLLKPQGKGEVWLQNFVKHCGHELQDNL